MSSSRVCSAGARHGETFAAQQLGQAGAGGAEAGLGGQSAAIFRVPAPNEAPGVQSLR